MAVYQWHTTYIQDKHGTIYGRSDCNRLEFQVALLAGFIARLKSKPSIHPGLDAPSCRIIIEECIFDTQGEEVTQADIELLAELEV